MDDVLPVWQLVRTSSAWRQCGAQPFEVAETRQWANIVDTLSFVKTEVRPAVGEVEALSVFRNEQLNGCSRGWPSRRTGCSSRWTWFPRATSTARR